MKRANKRVNIKCPYCGARAYTLLLGPAPQTAANPTMLMPVAA